MKINGEYVQYSKAFTTVVGLSYLVQVVATIILVCKCEYASSALLEILQTTTGLFGLTFGCYTGNSAVEKYITKKASIDIALGTNKTSSSGEG